MTLSRFLLRRLVFSVPVVIGVLFFTFALVRIGGQDPVALLAGPTATVQEIELVRRELGLDQPFFVQFAIYAQKVLSFDLGKSWLSNKPVLGELLDRLPVTFELMFWGILLGALVGIPVGLHAAFRVDRAFMLFVFFFLLEWAPPGMGRISLIVTPPPRITGSYLIDGLLTANWEAAHSALSQLVLPVICVAIVASAPIIKQTRAMAIEVLGRDYVRLARAAGLPERAVRGIVWRNALVPVATFIGTEITGLVGTASLIEYVFAWGGMGQYGLHAITSGDFAVVQGYVLFLALFSVLVFVIVDVLGFLLEPRAGGGS
jgi:peptide/nickel transport system permease protein